jgi:hypothetical protein
MANDLKAISPTGSYLISLPADISSEKDERVVSFWKSGKEALLQISSYVRETGPQVSATERLKARLDKERLTDVKTENMAIPHCPDCAAASGNEDGVKWLYCYAVWPDLTVLITISGPPGELEQQRLWAYEALRSLRRRSD